MKKNNKAPTMKEMAAALNLSISTISRALQNHKSIGAVTTKRVCEYAKEINFLPDRVAQNLRGGNSNMIFVMLPGLHDNYYGQIIRGIESGLPENRYNIFICNSNESPEAEKQLLELMLRQRAAAMIVSLSKETTDLAPFYNLAKLNIPLVFITSEILNKFHCIISDLYNATCEMTKNLIKLGCKNIALINGPQHLSPSKEREKAFLQTCGLHKPGVVNPLIYHSDLTTNSVHAIMDELLTKQVAISAIILYDDQIYLEALQFLKDHFPGKLKEIIFTSYDNSPFLKYLDCSLFARVEKYPFQQGKMAAELLSDLLNGEHIRLPSRMLKVESKVIYNQKIYQKLNLKNNPIVMGSGNNN